MQSGTPAPLPPMQYEKLGPNETLVAARQNPMGGAPTVSTVAQGQGELKPVFGATGPNGEPIMVNTDPNAPQHFVLGPAGSQAKQTTAQFRYEQALAAGLTGRAALDVMNGAKSLTDDEKTVARQKKQADFFMSQEQLGIPVTAEALRQWNRAWDAADAAKPDAAAAPASPAFTPAQSQAAKQFTGTKAPVGTPQNPYAPRTQAEYQSLKPGQYYIYTDGSIWQKAGQ
jgi:hypothetical protein